MTREKVIEIIAKIIDKDEELIHDDDDIFDDLGANSLDVIEIVVDVENAFGIVIDETAVIECRHVGEFCELIDGMIDN